MANARKGLVSLLAVVVCLVAVGCESDDDDGGGTTTSSVISTTTTAVTVPVTLPPDTRPRTEAVSATADFAGVPAQATFDLLAAAVVAAVEQLHPDPEEGPSLRTESAANPTADGGTILVRRHGFADDSVAGYEYEVTVAQGPQGWTVASATKRTICYRGVSGDLCT